MLIVGRVVAFIAVLASFLWLVRPEYNFAFTLHMERLITFLLALSTFLGTEIYSGHADKDKGWNVHPNDKDLLKRLMSELDPDGVVGFLRTHDFGGTFRLSAVDPVLRFSDRWVGADKEFQDEEVEEKHQELVEAAKVLSEAVALKTSPISGDAQSVVPEGYRGRDIPDWVSRDAREINESADRFVRKFDEFMKVARRKIPVDESGA